MMMNDEPVRVTIQQSTQMIEETLAANMRRFKGGNSSKQRREVRKKRSSRDADNSINNNFYNQGKLYNDDNSYYRHINGLDKTSSHYQYPNHQQQYQQHQFYYQQPQSQHHFQHQQVPPTSPLHITPPISSSHPLSSFQTPNQPIQSSNGHPLVMCPSQIQMPMPVQLPIPMPLSMPHVNFDGSVPPIPVQMPIQMPLQMPMHMPNMPLPMFIRLPAPPCVSPASSSSSDDNLKSNNSPGGVGSSSNGTTVVNFIPLMFPPHLGPMLLGPSQPVMVTRLPGSPNFHLMVNENQQRSGANHQQQQSQSSTK